MPKMFFITVPAALLVSCWVQTVWYISTMSSVQ